MDLAPASGNTFDTNGSETWALASYLNHLQIFAQADTPPALDQRVQNLSFRPDTVAHPRIVDLELTATSATLRIAAVIGFAYQVQASTDLIHWENLGWANADTHGLFRFMDADRALYPLSFYRVVRATLPTARLAVFSDPHYMDPSLLVSDGAAFQTYLAGNRKLLRESSAILDAAIEGILEAQPDIVLVAGDLTKDGERVSHHNFAAALRHLSDAGAKVFVSPGNHDVAEPVPGLWILAMDSARYDLNTTSPYTGGYFDALRWNWITNQLALGRAAGKFVVGMVHHGVSEHYPGQKALFPDHVLDDFETVRQTLASYGMKTVFTSHYHAQDIVRFDHPHGTLFDIQTGSLVTHPSPYRVMDLAADGALAITSYAVTNINFDLGGQEFPTYAYNFLTNGLLNLSAYLLMQPPYNLPEATAQFLAPAMTEAFSLHCMGDESSRPISAQTQGIIAFLQSHSDPLSQLFAETLLGLFDDPAPADNHIVLHLFTEATTP